MAAVEKKFSESERKLVEANERNHNQEKAHKEALQKDESAIASKFNCMNSEMLANK